MTKAEEIFEKHIPLNAELGYLPIKKEDIINAINEALRQQSANRFTEDDLRNAFYAGCKFENGDRKSWESYNKFTGKQQPNKEMNFEQWYESNYR